MAAAVVRVPINSTAGAVPIKNEKGEHLVVLARLVYHHGILVPVRTSFGLRRHGGKTYNVST